MGRTGGDFNLRPYGYDLMGFKTDVLESLEGLSRFADRTRHEHNTRLKAIEGAISGSKLPTLLQQMEHGIAATQTAGEGLQYVKQFICTLQKNQEDIVRDAKAADRRTSAQLKDIQKQLSQIIKYITADKDGNNENATALPGTDR